LATTCHNPEQSFVRRRKIASSSIEVDFVPRGGTVTALLIWKYLGGPWQLMRRLPFMPAPYDGVQPRQSRLDRHIFSGRSHALDRY
jgi:hypothetical protein